ncbi:MAG: DUF2357 domain-containing protein [Bacilli bacterium]|nr:DUF2357 domain-containing protein [Bacilli bacterium]
MVKAESRYKKLQKKYTTKVDPIFASDSEAKNVLDSLSRGRNAYLRMDRCESASMDNSWIKAIEDCLPALEDIVMNPRRTLTTEAEVVPVEKARRTTKESVIHLSAHTEYVKEVKPNGDVIPSKILNITNEDFYQTYENRFIASLIRRLLVFVNQRYQYIKEFNPLSDSQILYYKTNAVVNGENVEIETKITVAHPTNDDFNTKSEEFISRIDRIRDALRFFTGSRFMAMFKGEKNVRNPILQTNIIRKNPQYRKCYGLWCFIERYTKTGIDVKVNEEIQNFTPEEQLDVNKAMWANLIALKGKEPIEEPVKKTEKSYVSRIIKTLDEDMYTFWHYVNGPVKFIRIDDEYRKWKESPKDLNPWPTKVMAEYNKDEYEDNKKKKAETKAVDDLIKRRNKESKQYLRDTAEVNRNLKEERLAAKRAMEEEANAAEEARLNAIRQALMDEANKFNNED